MRTFVVLIGLMASAAAWAVPPAGFVYPSATFTVERDLRRCAAPLCGGWWIERVNLATMRCPDGTVDTACYVPEIVWADLGLDPRREAAVITAAEAGGVIVHGEVVMTAYRGVGDLGVLHPTRVWRARVP